MSELRKSLKRGSFQQESAVKSAKKYNKSLSEIEQLMNIFKTMDERKNDRENSEEFKKNNLEYDLRTSDYIAEKCKVEHYAQNLYAALCNNDFVKNDIWPILQGEAWSCSWRYAGGIVADIRQEGDYIDWYCSGIRGRLDDEKLETMTEEQKNRCLYQQNYFVGEGIITDEIRADLLKIGWLVKENND